MFPTYRNKLISCSVVFQRNQLKRDFVARLFVCVFRDHHHHHHQWCLTISSKPPARGKRSSNLTPMHTRSELPLIGDRSELRCHISIDSQMSKEYHIWHWRVYWKVTSQLIISSIICSCERVPYTLTQTFYTRQHEIYRSEMGFPINYKQLDLI